MMYYLETRVIKIWHEFIKKKYVSINLIRLKNQKIHKNEFIDNFLSRLKLKSP